MLRYRNYDIWPGQTGHGFKQKISQQSGKIQMPVKFEPQQGVAQGLLVKAVVCRTAPRRWILQACAADGVARLWIARRNPATRASWASVWGKQGAALGTEE